MAPQLQAVARFTAARFARAIVMPNLAPPVTTTALALAYRKRILDALPRGMKFEPLMTLYLTERTDPREIERAQASGAVWGCKLYPAGQRRIPMRASATSNASMMSWRA